MNFNLKHIIEYVALRMIAGMARILPYKAALSLGFINAWFSFFIVGFRRKEAISRILEVFGNRISRCEASNIAWLSWRNIIFNGIEMMRVRDMNLTYINSICDCKYAIDVLLKHSSSGKGGLIAVPHMGSWDMAAVICHLNGIPIFRIAARQKNPLTTEYLNKIRQSHGIDTMYRGSGELKEVIKRIKKGGMLAVMPDVRSGTEGINAPFLGKTANIGRGMASFAWHCDVPIFPCIVTRSGWCKHEIKIYDAVWPDKNLAKEEDIKRMTLAVMKIIDEAIARDPSQWFWFNKRWILEPI